MMNLSDIRFGSAAYNAPPFVRIAPDDPCFSVTDYGGSVSINSTRIRITRPITGIANHYTIAPGARVRCTIPARVGNVGVYYSALDLRGDIFNSYASVLIDGVEVAHITSSAPVLTPVAGNVVVPLDGNSHLLEIVFPYGYSMDFTGIYVPEGTVLSAASPARPTTVYGAMGDSITHGFYATTISTVWSYALALAKNFQYKNLGYGSQQCNASDGTLWGAVPMDVATYLIGYNDFNAQKPIATFKSSYTSFLSNLRAAGFSGKLYCMTPIYTTTVKAIPIEDYRTAIGDVLTAVGDSRNILVDGLSVMPNSSSYLTDGIHPNNTGSIAITNGMIPILSL